jgi:N-acetylmuramic acid 6-phosphate etherase
MTVSPDEPSAALPGDLAAPPTEQRNPRTRGIDVLPTLDVLRLLNAEDATVPGAVERVLGELALVVDEAADRMRRGGRVHYFGAGSSGRIAMLDATELVPTFGLEWGMVVAHLAGGEDAMVRAVEGAEDDAALGGAEAGSVGALDTVIGLSASGRTPYVAGALSAACARGAFTAVITCNPGSPLLSLAEVAIVPATGPEAIAGSTRMKATTAMKLVLNSFSTALMIRLGKTYSNLMVEVSATNNKLRGRKLLILREATGADPASCDAALLAAGGDLRLAMITLLGDIDVPTAREALTKGGGSVRGALDVIQQNLR